MKMGSIIGQKIDYKGVGALRGQWHIPSKHTSPGPKIQKLTKKLMSQLGSLFVHMAKRC